MWQLHALTTIVTNMSTLDDISSCEAAPPPRTTLFGTVLLFSPTKHEALYIHLPPILTPPPPR